MKKILIYFLILSSLFSFVGYASNLSITKDQWREDISYFAKYFKALDMSIAMLPKGEFDRETDKLFHDVDQLDGVSISIRIKQIIARIGDAHTTMGAPVNYLFPLYFLWMEDGLFVTGADQEHEQLIGSKVETINGVPVEQVLALLAPLISHENKQWLLKESTQLLRNPEVLKFIGVVSNIKAASFTFSCKDGKKETTEIPSFPAHRKLNSIYYNTHFNISLPLSQLKEMNSENYAYQYLPNYNTVYFKYNVCRESEHQPFAEFCKEMFDLIRKENVAHIIIDLRTNPGGDWIYFNRSFLPKLATSRVKQNENVYILIGRGTFSAGTWALWDLTKKGYTNSYGEPTGGKPWHYGDVRTFELPNSKLKIVYTTQFLKNGDPQADSFYPKYPVKVYSKDYFAGVDPVLEEVLGKIKEKIN